MKTRLFFLTLFLAMAMLLGRANELIMWFDSDQYNQWSASTSFVEGMKIIKNGNNNDIDNAISYFDQEFKLHPSNGYALCNKSMLMAIQTMMGSFEFSDSENPDSIAMGKRIVTEGMLQSLDLMEQGRQLIPAADSVMQANAWMWKAYFYKECGDTDSEQMIKCLEKSAEFRPDAELYKVLVEMVWDDDDMSKSEQYALKALELFPDNDEFLMLMTNISTQNKDYDAVLNYAERYINNAKQKEEDIDIDIVRAYAMALAQKGRVDDATDFIFSSGADYMVAYNSLKQIGAHPNMVLSKIGQREFTEEGNPVAWNMLRGLIYSFDKKDYNAATSSFLKAKNNNDPRIWNQCIGYSYYMAGDIPNALIHAKAANNVGVVYHYQQLRESLGMIDPLIDELNTKLSLSEVFTPQADAYVNLGKYYLLKKCPEQALEPLRNAVSMAPYLPKANLYYAMVLTDLGRSAEAIQPLEDIISTISDNSSTTNQAIQAQACAMLGRSDEAHTILESLEKTWHPTPTFISEEVRNIDGSDVTCYDIAAIYAMLGDNAKATEWIAKHFESDELPYNFGYMALDSRFDAIKSQPEFKQLVEKYYFQWKNNK